VCVLNLSQRDIAEQSFFLEIQPDHRDFSRYAERWVNYDICVSRTAVFPPGSNPQDSHLTDTILHGIHSGGIFPKGRNE
jgi:hypothetical protein